MLSIQSTGLNLEEGGAGLSDETKYPSLPYKNKKVTVSGQENLALWVSNIQIHQGLKS